MICKEPFFSGIDNEKETRVSLDTAGATKISCHWLACAVIDSTASITAELFITDLYRFAIKIKDEKTSKNE